MQQFVERAGAEVALGHPGDGLDVAQAAGAGLHVGLEVVGGVVGLGVALLLLGDLGFEVRLAPARCDPADTASRMSAEQLRIAGQQARFEQRGHHADVGGAFLGALGDGAHAVADFEIDVPQERDQAFDHAAAGVVGRGRHQDQDVDVGVRMQLAASVAADGRERPARRIRPAVASATLRAGWRR